MKAMKAQVVISTFSSVASEQHVNAMHEEWSPYWKFLSHNKF